MSAEVETKPAEATKPVEQEESKEAPVEATKLLAQGKRNLVCGEIPSAVNELQEACALLAATFGETAKECGECYFYYGQALLELARMETGVLGNALQGVPEEDTEDDAEPSEQFETAEKVTGEELEKIRDEVYDAMSEPDPPKSSGKEAVNGDAKVEKTEESSMDTDENKENVESTREDIKETVGKKPVEDKTQEDTKNEKNTSLSDKTELNKKEENASEMETETASEKKGVNGEINGLNKDDVLKEVKGENENNVGDKPENVGKEEKLAPESKDEAEPTDEAKATDETKPADESKTTEEAKPSDGKTETSKKEGDTEAMEVTESKDEGEKEDGEEDGDEEEEGTAEEDEGEATAEEGDADPGEGTSSGKKGEEDPDDISNLQLSWEMLELAKVIYLKQEDKEMKLKAAQAYLKLGEVSIETEQYEQAISDIGECFKIQKELLEQDDRLLAETQYQLGLALSFNKNFEEAIDSFRGAVKVIEERINNLQKIVEEGRTAERSEEKPAEKAEEKKEEEKSEEDNKESCVDTVDQVEKAEKEIQDLKEILPDIRAKIDDVLEERKNMDVVKEMAKDVFTSQMKPEGEAGTIGTQPSSSDSDVKPTDISHLIRKKRKQSDVEEEAETKKCRQEDGSGDAPVLTNGNHDTTDKAKEDVKEVESKDVPMVTDDKAEAVST